MKNYSILFSSLRVLLGLVFILSGITKLFPIEYFELLFVKQQIVSWALAPYVARLFIGLEIALGVFLITGLRVKLTFFVSLGLLILFTIYLIGININQGNSENCGCFGTFITMSPKEAIIKNLVMIGIVFLLLKFNSSNWFQIPLSTYALISILCFLSPFLLNRLTETTVKVRDKEAVNFYLNITSIADSSNLNKIQPLNKGKQIVGFLTYGCKHCRVAAAKAQVIKSNNAALPITFIMAGNSEKKRKFF